MGNIVPILLALVGIGAGGAIGYVLKPAPEAKEETVAGAEAADGHMETADAGLSDKSSRFVAAAPTKATDSEYLALSRKMIVPFRRPDGDKAFLALDISLELAPGATDHAKIHEPKLIDAFLRTLVSFAATGAFNDESESAHTLQELNHTLLDAARAVLGEEVREVLIANMLTQDA